MSVRRWLGTPCEGTIKSFGPDKGWGFIKGDGFGEDIFVSFKLCPNLQVGGDLTGQRVTFVPVENSKKNGSFEAQSCDLHEGFQLDSSGSLGKWIDATVKSWNPAKGWGFVTNPRIAGDIFISKKLCPMLATTQVLPSGQVVRVKVGESKSTPGSFEATDMELKNKGMGKGNSGNSMPALGGLNLGGLGTAQQNQLAQLLTGLLGGAAGNLNLGNLGGSLGKRMTGTVKSFVPMKGWGFLLCKQVNGDIFVSNKTSPGVQALFESNGVTPGTSVQFTLAESKSNPGAYEATNLTLSGRGGQGGYGAATGGKGNSSSTPYGKPKGGKASQSGMMSIGQSVTGTIKSFAAIKGWGFVNSDSFDDDCFFNIKNNPHLEGSQAQLQPGTPVSFTVQESATRAGALEGVDIVM